MSPARANPNKHRYDQIQEELKAIAWGLGEDLVFGHDGFEITVKYPGPNDTSKAKKGSRAYADE